VTIDAALDIVRSGLDRDERDSHLDPGMIAALRHVTSLYETYAKGDVEQMGSDARARVESAREVLADVIGELAGTYRVEGVAQG
jgi:hypothetical protein